MIVTLEEELAAERKIVDTLLIENADLRAATKAADERRGAEGAQVYDTHISVVKIP